MSNKDNSVHGEVFTSFGEKLKQLRDANNMSQNDLAKVLHVNKGTLGNYECGIRKAPLDFIVKVSKFFHISVDDLLDIKIVKKKDEVIQRLESNIANSLKDLRYLNKMSSIEMASEIDISVEELKLYESGVKEVPPDVIQKVADLFNVTIEDILQLSSIRYKHSAFISLEKRDVEIHKQFSIDLDIFNWTDKEINELVNYAEFIKSKRGG